MSFTVTKQEFKKIHNSICELNHFLSSIDSILNEELTVRAKNALSGLQEGLKNLREQESAEFDRKYRMYENFAKENNLKNSHWSIYEVESMNDPHPFKGVRAVQYYGWEFEIEGNTWGDIWKVADKIIEKSGDYHNYIEDFKLTYGGILKMTTGS